MLAKVQQGNPPVFLHHVVKPLLIIGVVAVVEIEHVFSNEHKFGHPSVPQRIDDFPFQKHDVVEEAVVPFSNEFQHGMPLVVIGVQHFRVQGLAAKLVPLRVNEMVVHLQVVGEFIVHAVVERTLRIVARDVVVAPGVVGLKNVHVPCCEHPQPPGRCRGFSIALLRLPNQGQLILRPFAPRVRQVWRW